AGSERPGALARHASQGGRPGAHAHQGGVGGDVRRPRCVFRAGTATAGGAQPPPAQRARCLCRRGGPAPGCSGSPPVANAGHGGPVREPSRSAHPGDVGVVGLRRGRARGPSRSGRRPAELRTNMGDQKERVGHVLLGELIAERLDDHWDCLVFEGRTWTWAQYARECVDRANVLLRRRADGPFHVGVLLDNVPDFVMLLGAAALSGAVVVGLNPTRRGPELARDVAQTDCQLIITEQRYRALLGDVGDTVRSDRILTIDDPAWPAELVSV